MTAPGGDDMGEKIARLLSSPEGMAKIRAAMAAFGGGDIPAAPAAESAPADEPPPLSTPKPNPAAGGLPDAAALTRLLPLVGTLSKEDDDTRLLQALRPYLHGAREQRLDEAVKLLKLSHLLPLLQAQGILGGKPPAEGGEPHG